MRKLNRRQFLGTTVVGTVAASATAGFAKEQATHPITTPAKRKPFDRPLCFQSYGMRRQVEEDFPGMLKMVRELGYDGVEMCSPRSYVNAGYGNLTDVPPEDIKMQIEDSGLFCKSSHFSWREVFEHDPAETAEYAAAMGLEDIIMSSSGIGNDATPDAIKRWGEKANKAGEIIKATGLRLGYHNHAVGPMVGDTPEYELIMEATDPDLVTMQFQLASISGGFDIVYYLEKYAGRYSSLHIHDYDPTIKGRRPGRLGGVVPCGEGMIDWQALLKAAMMSDIADHGFIVEIETEEPLEGLRKSYNYLRTVDV